MVLDVSIPDSPSLHGPQPRGEYEAIDNPVSDPEDDYRREEIETILASGAWNDAFEEWAAQTGLTAATFEVVVEYDLIDDFDFYWDATTDEVGYQSPTIPQAARDVLDTEVVDEIESELDTLGRVVSEMLENDYLLRDDETFGFFADDTSENTYESRDGE
ncbi:hypothetical protein VB773_20485 [Haloarculaceae archaeon H-GB2-1]|nr:hypothetical protein [Haloarculaceae archaeon H-GB1-1]MEA5409719.1 hypothetical protein [Haloarculaceae archaeon H-GB2-1]